MSRVISPHEQGLLENGDVHPLDVKFPRITITASSCALVYPAEAQTSYEVHRYSLLAAFSFMSVLFETSLGDIVIDLETELCPKTCENFLKLCKVYYYNLNAFFNVSKDFLAQAGDPTATGTGGESIWSYLASTSTSQSPNEPKPPRYFAPEIRPKLKHTKRGTVSMAVAPALTDASGEHTQGGCGSQFFITLGENVDYLDGKHAVFGHVVEGEDTLEKINEVFVDQDSRPYKDIRIRHVVILDDPFPDPPNLIVPPSSPTRPPDNSTRIAEDEDPLFQLPEEEEERIRREKAAAASALTLEMVGDLPFANVRPPENVLFVCKLNPVTRDEDLELIFSRFGSIMSCQVIRDKKTGDSLQYAFIEFDKREEAEQAYFKMQNVLVDDRRIWVDFSQSVARMNTHWSNDIKVGPRQKRGGDGFGGRIDLERTKRYRDEDNERNRGDGYGMVFDVSGHHDQRRGHRDRSPGRDDRSRRPKDRSKSPRERERHVDRYREIDRDRQRHRSRDRSDYGRRR
ncbi:hypothetical protein NP233_g4663 [Leucocoprinus birnbaumii]|uniref:Peptidyl-prolyl cis-trans isomerase n=1 Tax=Leucocoprinus birnbaumii TaxID=56174 RepID=A0AAD5VWN3_9AGAR|nr:hypothetical protein NP233_g4663 [Leucocoprinus birnbaumii]